MASLKPTEDQKLIRDRDALLQRLHDLRQLQRSRPVTDAEIAELLDGHLQRPSSPEEMAVVRIFLLRGPAIATFTGLRQLGKLLREQLQDTEGSTTIPRWGSWREFSTVPKVAGEPPDEMSTVHLTRGGLDLLEAVPARARRRAGPTEKIEVSLHLGRPAHPDNTDVLTVVMGDHRIGTVDVGNEPGLSQLAADTVHNGRMLALEGYLVLSTPPHAFIELYYR